LTLDGTIQRLSSVLTDPEVGGADDEALRVVQLQMQGNSANPLFVGGAPKVGTNVTLTSTDHGFRLEPGSGGVPTAPYLLGEFETGPIRLSDVYVLGTNAEVLHIMVLGF
jgi:hypothetical protein